MKLFSVLIALLLSSSLASAGGAESTTSLWNAWLSRNTHPVSDTSDGESYADLEPFGKAIGKAQIVLLDEQTHGEENVFALKSRLVRYLHEKQGFDVLVMESGLYDIDRMWQKASESNTLRMQAPGNLFYMYANSPAVLNLLDYIQEQKNGSRPLVLSGMDSQHTGNYASAYLLSDLQAYLKSKGSRLPDDAFWPAFSDLTSQLLRMQRDEPEPSVEAQYFRFVARLKSALSAEDDYFWHRVVLSIENQAQRYWGLRFEQRSDVMGENLKALIKYRYPGKKIIVWGQYVHLNRAGLPNGGNTGYAISRLFGEKAYVVHFTSNHGSFYNFIEDRNTPVIRFPLKTIENLLEKQTGPYNFTDWRNLPRKLREDTTIAASMFHYLPDGFLAVPQAGLPSWSKQVDGTFYLDRIISPKP